MGNAPASRIGNPSKGQGYYGQNVELVHVKGPIRARTRQGFFHLGDPADSKVTSHGLRLESRD